MDLLARLLIGALPGLGRQEKLGTIFWHPGADSQFSVAVAGGSVDVIHTIFKQQVKRPIGFGLCHLAKCCRPEKRACAEVSGSAKNEFRNHNSSPSQIGLV